MQHPFFEKSKKDQGHFQLKLAGLTLLFNLLMITSLWVLDTSLLLLAPFVLFISISIIAPFYDVPALVKQGKLTYHSAFLFAERPKNGRVKIHGGTLFDYYFCLPKNWTGPQRVKYIFAEYLGGLLDLAAQLPPDCTVRGTSYFLNVRTAERVGLRRAKTDFGQALLLGFNFFRLFVSISFAKKKLVFPRVWRVVTCEGRAGDILDKKTEIEALRKLLIKKDIH